MKLERFKKDNKRKNITLILGAIILVLCGGILLYKSYADYELEESFDIIKGQVPEFTTYDIKLAYKIDGVTGTSSFPKQNTNYTVTGVTCQNGATASWDNDTWSLSNVNPNGNSKVSCSIEFSTGDMYKEELLNGAYPVLASNLIPVTIDDDGTVKKANITSEWYSYENKIWANAIILKDESVSYSAGDVISEENIESYFVWIPKYSYKLWDLGEYTSADSSALSESVAHEIEIKFGITNTSDDKDGECTTPMTSGATGNCKVDEYMTHPAFLNFNTTGLWVGKFETGYKGATTTSEAEITNISPESIIVKPNVYSWRNNTVYNFFLSSYYYKRDLNSHMMKNTEWGAVAYLSYSKYGKNDEVWINNNLNYVTGCVGSSVSESYYNGCQNVYNTTTGYNGSTTGNISGIYDMSGGAWEYMAAYINGNSGNSGFQSDYLITFIKYLDVYNANSNATTYNYRMLGDATGELGPFYLVGSVVYNNWYNDISQFVFGDYPWFVRGGECGVAGYDGLLTFGAWSGYYTSVYNSVGSRLVLAI